MTTEEPSIPMNPLDIEELKAGRIKLPKLVDLNRQNIVKSSLATNGSNWLVEDRNGNVFLLSSMVQARLLLNDSDLEKLPEITIYT